MIRTAHFLEGMDQEERRAVLAPYMALLDAIGDDRMERLDREEAHPWREAGCYYTFHGLTREEQAEILACIDLNLERTKRVNYRRSPSSYGIKHAVERAIGTYTSNLQAKVAMRILGFEKSADMLNPRYNIGARSWNRFHDAYRGLWYRGRVM